MELSPAVMKGLSRYFRRHHHLPTRVILAIASIYAGLLIMYLLSFRVLDWLLSEIPHGNGTSFARVGSNILGVILMIAALAYSWWKLNDINAKEFAKFIAKMQSEGRPPCCFACGYDLQGGRADHCPECGEKLPWLGVQPGPTTT